MRCLWPAALVAAIALATCNECGASDHGSGAVAPPPNAPSAPKAGDNAPAVEVDTSGHGAVLCTYWIYLDLQSFGEKCFPQDSYFQATLAGEIARIEKFIMENGPATPADIGQMRAHMRADVANAACDGDVKGVYLTLRHHQAELHSADDELLSVPRKPEINPCL
jgi:hypothetical protein